MLLWAVPHKALNALDYSQEWGPCAWEDHLTFGPRSSYLTVFIFHLHIQALFHHRHLKNTLIW